ncbi:Ig-like domain-containing protein [Vibrio coralliilyticus]|uniref:Ig-like domain-containing protein n=1 Tax=Vibrio coralliilyticus TaxID=190893 RepID=UPI0017C03EA7|nr:Ig-like domain-containing protein [Vibrio coralliilyticus]NUW70132.1 Ig-like domain repeat protein [Vibrio coralliilyticus]
MSDIIINNSEDINVDGFDLIIKTEQGKVEKIENGLTSFLKGELSVKTSDNGLLSKSDLIGKVNVTTMSSVLVPSLISSSDASDEEVDGRLKDINLEDSDESAPLSLKKQLEQLKELKALLDKEKEELEKEKLDEENLQLAVEEEASSSEAALEELMLALNGAIAVAASESIIVDDSAYYDDGADGEENKSDIGSSSSSSSSGTSDSSPVVEGELFIEAELDAASGSDSGSVGDWTTNISSPTISGTSVAGLTVTVTIAGITQTTTVDANGNWSVSFPTLPDGEHTVVAQVTDSGGNIKTVEETITIDTVNPEVESKLITDSGYYDDDGVTNSTNPTFSGTGEPGSTVTVVINDISYNTVVSDDGSWSIEVTEVLQDGTYEYVVLALDAAGNDDVVTGTITVDTQVHVNGDLSDESDSGNNTTDNYTNDTQPKFNGTGEAGAMVEVTLSDGQDTFSHQVVVSSEGVWVVDFADTEHVLSDGTYSVVISTTDIAGNSNHQNSSIIIDTVSHLSYTLDSDTGESSGDHITQDTTLQFSGTAEAGSMVSITLYDSGRDLVVSDEIEVGGDALWSLSLSPEDGLIDGDYFYEISAVDIAGNSTTQVGKVTVDTEVQYSGGLVDQNGTESDGIISSDNPSFSGEAEIGATVTVTIYQNGRYVDSQSNESLDGSWEISFVGLDLQDGDYTYQVYVLDVAGNEYTSEITPFQVDTIYDSLTADLASESNSGEVGDNTTNVTNPELTGQGEPGASIKLTVSGHNYSEIFLAEVDSNGVWAITIGDEGGPLDDGQYSYTVESFDVAGNRDQASGQFTIDTHADIDGGLVATSDSGSVGDNITSDSTPSFAGVVEQGSTVRVTITDTSTGKAIVDGEEVRVDSEGSWSYEVSTALNDGTYEYTFDVEDVAGNTNFINDTFTVDQSVSNLSSELESDTGSSDSDGVTNSESIHLAGNVEAGSTIRVEIYSDPSRENYVDGSNGVVEDDGTWNVYIDAENWSDGDYYYTVIAVDVAGNTKADEGSFVLDTETVEPTLSVEGDDDFIISDEQPVFSGTAEADAEVTLELTNVDTRDNVNLSATVNSFGDWTIDLATHGESLVDGTYSYVLTSVDIAGNTNDSSGFIVIDTQSSLTGGVVDSDGTSGDDVVSTTAPIFSGTADPMSDITITLTGGNINGSLIAVGETDAEGNWEIDLSEEGHTLNDGVYQYNIIAVDIAGNTSDPVSGNLTIDTYVAEPSTDIDSSNEVGDTLYVTDSTPTFRGNTEPHANIKIEIYAGSTTDGHPVETLDVDANANGDWVINFAELGQGVYTYVLTVTDVAGNEASTQSEIIIDSIIEADAGLDGTSDPDSDGRTNQNTPTLSGQAEEGSKITVTIKAQEGGYEHTYTEVIVDSSGSWSLTLDHKELEDGIYNYSVLVVDVAGNSDTLEGSFTIDTVAEISGGLDVNSDTGDIGDDVTSERNPTFSGEAETGSTVTLVITLSGSNEPYYQGSTTIDAGESWSITVNDPMESGAYDYYLITQDVAGNQGMLSGQITILADDPTIDAVLVNDTGFDDEDGLTKEEDLTFTGTVTPPGSNVEITLTSVTDPQTSFSESVASDPDTGIYTITLYGVPDGVYNYVATVTDVAGNTADVNGTVEVDSSISELTLTVDGSSGDTHVTNNEKPAFSGTGEEGAKVYLEINTVPDNQQVYSGSTTVVGGSWSIAPDINLPEGDYTYTVIAVDDAGNSTQETGDLTIDVTAPDVTGGLQGEAQGDAITSDPMPTLTGTAETGATVHLLVVPKGDDTPVFRDSVVAQSGTWTIDVDLALSAGEYDVVMVAVDIAGNQSEPEHLTLTVDLDTQDPTVGLTAVSDTGIQDDGITSQQKPGLSGTAEPGAEVFITITGVSEPQFSHNTSAIADSDGDWFKALSVELADGEYLVEVYAIDIAGNHSSVVPMDLTIDTEIGDLEVFFDESYYTPTDDDDYYYSKSKDNNINGSGEIGSTVKIYSGEIEVASTVVGNSGEWEVDVSLSDGIYDLRIVMEDAAGNTTTSHTTLHVDTTMGANAWQTLDRNDTGESAEDGITKDNQLGFYVQGLSAGDEATITITGDDNEYRQTFVVESSGSSISWEIPEHLAPTEDGAYTMTVNIKDAAGNTASHTIRYQLDTEIENVNKIDIVAEGNTIQEDGKIYAAPGGDGKVDITVNLNNAPDIYRATLYIDGKPYTMDISSGGLHANIALDDGEYSMYVEMSDVAGNIEQSPEVDLVVDNLYEGFSVTTGSGETVEDGSLHYSNTDTLMLYGTGEAGGEVSVKVNGVEQNIHVDDDTGDWVVQLQLDEDSLNTIVIEVMDPAGNVEGVMFTVESDTYAPLLTSFIFEEESNSIDGQMIFDDAEVILATDEGFTLTTQIEPTSYEFVEVTINGEPVQYEIDGVNLTIEVSADFIAEHMAGNSSNVMEIIVTDAAGNAAVFDLTIDANQMASSSAEENEPSVETGTDMVEEHIFEGSSGPGTEVEISMAESTETVVADDNGDWSFTFSANEPGSYDYQIFVEGEPVSEGTVDVEQHDINAEESASERVTTETSQPIELTSQKFTPMLESTSVDDEHSFI